jgi:hypothetical protein
MDQINHEELNDVEAREKYQIKISNKFVALENLDDRDINRT